MSGSESIGIAGAGLLGRLLAWRLLRLGYRVTLYDAGARDAQQAAGWTAAGMVAPLSEAVVSERPVYEMGLYALSRWPEWLAQLALSFSQSQASVSPQSLWNHNGSLVVAHSQDEAELYQFHRELQFVTGSADGYQWLNDAELQRLEPDLSHRFQRGLLLEHEGFLDNRALLTALLEAIETLGGTTHFHTPVTVDDTTLCSAGGRDRFDHVVDCRGVGAKPDHSDLRGVRGEILHVHTRDLTLQRPVRLVHPRYQLYVVPKPNQHFVIGATQIESEDRSPMTLQSSLELSSALYTLAPAFAEARIIEQSVNLRPTFADNNPRIQRRGQHISVNGLFRHGYLLAPAVVEQVLTHFTGSDDTPFAAFLQTE